MSGHVSGYERELRRENEKLRHQRDAARAEAEDLRAQVARLLIMLNEAHQPAHA